MDVSSRRQPRLPYTSYSSDSKMANSFTLPRAMTFRRRCNSRSLSTHSGPVNMRSRIHTLKGSVYPTQTSNQLLNCATWHAFLLQSLVHLANQAISRKRLLQKVTSLQELAIAFVEFQVPRHVNNL